MKVYLNISAVKEINNLKLKVFYYVTLSDPYLMDYVIYTFKFEKAENKKQGLPSRIFYRHHRPQKFFK